MFSCCHFTFISFWPGLVVFDFGEDLAADQTLLAGEQLENPLDITCLEIEVIV